MLNFFAIFGHSVQNWCGLTIPGFSPSVVVCPDLLVFVEYASQRLHLYFGQLQHIWIPPIAWSRQGTADAPLHYVVLLDMLIDAYHLHFQPWIMWDPTLTLQVTKILKAFIDEVSMSTFGWPKPPGTKIMVIKPYEETAPRHFTYQEVAQPNPWSIRYGRRPSSTKKCSNAHICHVVKQGCYIALSF